MTGTVKRWLYEGMPAVQSPGHRLHIEPTVADVWVAEHKGGTISRFRQSVVYVVRRASDGAIKIGWTSDTERRLRELRRDERSPIALLAAMPGDKPDELALQARFESTRLEGEWFSPSEELLAFVDGLSVQRIARLGGAVPVDPPGVEGPTGGAS
jgi:hypothetical protein